MSPTSNLRTKTNPVSETLCSFDVTTYAHIKHLKSEEGEGQRQKVRRYNRRSPSEKKMLCEICDDTFGRREKR
jgi:hypothetical protein